MVAWVSGSSIVLISISCIGSACLSVSWHAFIGNIWKHCKHLKTLWTSENTVLRARAFNNTSNLRRFFCWLRKQRNISSWRHLQANPVDNLNTSLFLSINLLSADEEISLFSVYKNMFGSQGIMYNKGTKAPHEWGKIDKELHVFLKIRKLS